MSQIKVFVFDDAHAIIEFIKGVVDGVHDLVLSGSARSGSKIQKLLSSARPDVVILDLNMDKGDFRPVPAIRQAVENWPKIAILAYTHDTDRVLMRRVLNAGARGYLLKDDDLSTDFESVIRKLYNGERVLSREVIDMLVSDSSDMLTKFKPNELKIIAMVSQSHTNHSIADALGLSERYVRNLLTGIYSKLDIRGDDHRKKRFLLVAKARSMGLLKDQGGE